MQTPAVDIQGLEAKAGNSVQRCDWHTWNAELLVGPMRAAKGVADARASDDALTLQMVCAIGSVLLAAMRL